MKKTWKMLLLGTALTTAMTFSAGAANFTNCADALHEMGLFSGTDKGYELDRAPTRAESAVMLVRLLGGEKEATEKNYKTPFTDVPDWAAPYVGWLYENDLTAGATETTFGTNGKCTAQMYSAFLLRSLGYADTGASPDFQYANAVKFATEKGVADYANCDEKNFLRDNVVAMSYTALATEPKDGKHDTLLDQLIADGAVDSAKAANTKETFKVFKEYDAISQKTAKLTDVEMHEKTNMDAKLAGANFMTVTTDMTTKANMNLEKLDSSKISSAGKSTMTVDKSLVEAGKPTTKTIETEMYYTDGNCYTKMGDEKIKIPMSFEAIIGDLNLTATQSLPICMLETIEKNDNDSFKISYVSSVFVDIANNALKGAGITADQAMTLNKADITVTFKNGTIYTTKTDMDMSMTVEGQKVDMTMTMDCDVTATGSSVKVTLPNDLNTYKPMQ